MKFDGYSHCRVNDELNGEADKQAGKGVSQGFDQGEAFRLH